MSKSGYDLLKSKDPKLELKKIRDSFLYEKLDIRSEGGYWFRRDRVLRSVTQYGNDKLYKQIKRCGREFKIKGFRATEYDDGVRQSACCSLWCDSCRRSIQTLYGQRILGQRILPGKLDTSIKRTSPDDIGVSTFGTRFYDNKDLLHITGVLGICNVNINSLRDIINRDNLKWKRIRKRVNKYGFTDDLWIECVYEFELVNWRLLNKEDKDQYKRKQMEQIIERQKFQKDVFLFVHFHGLTNLTKDQLRNVFKDEYYHRGKRLIKTDETGLFVQSLHKNRTVEENVKRICNYPFKNPYGFKHSFIGSDYKSGEKFTFEELGELVSIYDQFQGRQHRSLMRTVENQKYWDLLRLQTNDTTSTVDRKGNVFQLSGNRKNSDWLNYRSILWNYIVGGIPMNRLMSQREFEELKNGGLFPVSEFPDELDEFGQLHHSNIEGLFRRRLIEYLRYGTLYGKKYDRKVLNDDMEYETTKLSDYEILKLVKKTFKQYNQSKTTKV